VFDDTATSRNPRSRYSSNFTTQHRGNRDCRYLLKDGKTLAADHRHNRQNSSTTPELQNFPSSPPQRCPVVERYDPPPLTSLDFHANGVTTQWCCSIKILRPRKKRETQLSRLFAGYVSVNCIGFPANQEISWSGTDHGVSEDL
jgi:hypothetical protein